MKGSEWTLMLFTLLAQTAVGLFFALCLANNFTNWKNSLTNAKEVNDKFMFLICAIMAAALIVSFFHLGNVKNAIYTLSNISNSWLSREIFFVLIFSTLTFSFALLNAKNLFAPQVRSIIEITAVASGIILVFVMAKIYMLQNVPAWNSAFTPAAFYFSALIIGGLTFLAVLIFVLQKQEVDFSEFFQMAGIIKFILGVVLLLVFAELIVWLSQIVVLSGGERASVDSYNLIVKSNFLPFVIRIIFQFAVLLLLSIEYLSLSKGVLNPNYIYISYVLILFAEFLGRYLFYAMFSGIGV
jgi:anaerobic dimethyl sulfoxide reductase subunit C